MKAKLNNADGMLQYRLFYVQLKSLLWRRDASFGTSNYITVLFPEMTVKYSSHVGRGGPIGQFDWPMYDIVK
jgi:hypothetical protein